MSDTGDVSAVPYDRFFGLCNKAFQRHGSIFSLPVAAHPYEYLKFMYDLNYQGGRVLDFGCGTQKPLQKVLGIGDDLYHSCDNDPSGMFTYASLNEIPQEAVYEIVASNQVFEHLSFEEGIQTAMVLTRHVAPGSILQIGVPNPAHPTRFLSSPVHKTPWNYFNLCALIELGGLDPFYCARCNKVPGPRWYERPFVNIICRVFRMDWCDTVYVVGRRIAEDG